MYSKLSFELNTQYINLMPLLVNNFTPSTLQTGNLVGELSHHPVNKNSYISLALSQLDLVNGSNNNFVFLLTSNPQNTPNNLTYYSTIDLGLHTKNSHDITTPIRFHNTK